jgi:hypothetical protein
MIDSIFELDHPALRESLQQAPKTRIKWIQSDVVEGKTHVYVWAEGGHEEAFQDAMIEDPTVSLMQARKYGDRRLYRFILINSAAKSDMYPCLVDDGGFIRELTASPDGWRFHVMFPGYNAASRLYDFFADHKLDFTVRKMKRDGFCTTEQEKVRATQAEYHH